MDYIDQAQAEIEQTLRAALERREAAPAVVATGACLNCGEPLGTGVRWCSATCRDDWLATEAGDRLHPT
jgi:hypothetical protein